MGLIKPPHILQGSVVFIIILCFCHCLPPHTGKVYKNLIDGKGLFEESDHVAILNVTNFRHKIFGTNNAWVVVFYNSWCGHCFVFAPKWKALASDIIGWSRVVKLGSIDCSTEENNPTCRDYDVMGYPTLKFFPALAPVTSPGTELPRDSIGSGSPPELQRAIVGILRKEQIEGRGTHWPNITPLRNSDVSGLNNDPAKYVFFLFEHEDSSLGTEIILDFSNMTNVEIRTVLSDNEALASTMGIRIFPSLVYLSHGSVNAEQLHPSETTRESFREAITAFLEAKGLTVPKPPPPASPSEIPLPNMNELMQLHHAKQELNAIKAYGDVVFIADLETALRYMLNHEIPTRKTISGDSMIALRNFLAVLAKYFPAGEAGITYLKKLRDTVHAQSDNLHGVRFKKMVLNTDEGLNSVLSTQEGYLGCRGSQPHLRGFPCGVWTMFHYFTISALRSTDSMEVLNAMLGYITHFFGCTHCSQHFQEMAARSMKAKVTDAEQAAIWLWSAHNEVNARLSGTPTDDPEFLKIQYPSPSQCPRCRDSTGRWSESAVLAYLTNKYHQDSLNYEGANSRPPEKPSRKLVDIEESPSKSSKPFNSLDITICIALYGTSVLILGAVCWKFVLRRHYRRKTF